MISSMRLRNSGRNALPQLVHAAASRGPRASRSSPSGAKPRRCRWMHGGADVAGHDDDRVLEVHGAALAVREPAVVEDLQQRVEHVRVRLLDLVEEDDAVRAAPHRLGELAALVVAHVAGRRADEPRHGVLLHVLAHVEADQRRLVVEQELGQRPRQLGLAHARGAEEDERADRALGVLEAGARAAHGLAHGRHGAVLADHALVQLLLHGEQLVGLLLQHALHRDAGPLAHELGDVVRVHGRVGDALVREPRVLGGDEGLLDLVGLLLELRGALVVLRLHGRRALARELLQAQLHLAQVGRQHGRLDAQLAGRLVEQVDGLVRQEAVADVAVARARPPRGSRRR